MEITNVKFRPIVPADPNKLVQEKNPNIWMAGFASATVNGVALYGLKLKVSTKSGENRVFVEEPRVLCKDGKYRPLFHPANVDTRRALTQAILAARAALLTAPAQDAPQL